MENNSAKSPILIVDDENVNLKVLERNLSVLNTSIYTASSGAEAIKTAQNIEFAVILMDISMPEMNGFEAANQIRSNPVNSHTPVIFVTAMREDEYIFEGYEAGGVDFLYKPVDTSILKSKVTVFLELYAQKEALRISDERFKLFMESSTDCITLFDADMKVIDINSNTLYTMGVTKSEVIGKDILEIEPGLAETDRFDKYKLIIKEGSTYVSTYEKSQPNQQNKYFMVKAFKLGDGLGIVETDITAERNAELERQIYIASREREKIVDQMAESLIIINMEGIVTSINPAFTSLTGKDREEIVDRDYKEMLKRILKQDYIKKAKQHLTAALKKQILSEVEWVLSAGDEEEIPVLVSMSFLREDDENPIALICTLRDFTEYKNFEKKLLEKDQILSEQNALLTQKNIALREVMSQLEEAKTRIETQIKTNVDRLVLPILKKVRSNGSAIEKEYLDLMNDNLEAIVSTFGNEISRDLHRLTKKEIELCNLLKSNFTSKEIGRLMGISVRTVETHRSRIRKKLGIRNKGVNMASYLSSM